LPLTSTLFPYTTLFRSRSCSDAWHARSEQAGAESNQWPRVHVEPEMVCTGRLSDVAGCRRPDFLHAWRRFWHHHQLFELSTADRSEEHTSELQSPCNLV